MSEVDLEPKEEWYRVSEDELAGQPGELIRYQALEQTADAALRDASATYRVLYVSTSGTRDWRDRRIGVSGLIAFPAGRAASDGAPFDGSTEPCRVVSWAHGTVGSADKCAPSMDPYLEVEPDDEVLGLLRKINMAPHKLLNAFLRAGWAVAMTDYEGLGTYGVHPYLLGESEGRGILDIVPAVRHLADQAEVNGPEIADEYVIVGHSQGGQAALFGAHLAHRDSEIYADRGTLLGVAALAPASNLKGTAIPLKEEDMGLLAAYQLPTSVEDLAGFIALFTNGVVAGNPGIKLTEIFQEEAKRRYDEDHNELARVELSEDPFWKNTRALTVPRPQGIFSAQGGSAWTEYWEQVDDFNPDREISVPIRISQAEGDVRVQPPKTRKLIRQLCHRLGTNAVTEKFYEKDTVQEPDPAGLGEHFGLLVDDTEIDRLLTWATDPSSYHEPPE